MLVTGFVARPAWAAETDGPSGHGGARARPPAPGGARRLSRRPSGGAAPGRVPPRPRGAARCDRGAGRAGGGAPGGAREGAARSIPRTSWRSSGPAGPSTAATTTRGGGRWRPLNAPLDALFLRRRAGTVTIGIGDGGNEIGMGRVRARVVRDVPNGAKIASVVRTDHLVVAGTSNWGAWGVVAHLGAGHRPRPPPHPEGGGAADPRDGPRGGRRRADGAPHDPRWTTCRWDCTRRCSRRSEDWSDT